VAIAGCVFVIVGPVPVNKAISFPSLSYALIFVKDEVGLVLGAFLTPFTIKLNSVLAGTPVL
jgi:hypothetical protein